MKKGFSLAEVLITLGIIGVVAVITIPNLINMYKVNAIKTRFKTVDSMLQQAILKTSEEVGMDLTSLTVDGKATDGGRGQAYKDLQAQIPAINQAWVKQFAGATKINGNEMYYHIKSGKGHAKYYTGLNGGIYLNYPIGDGLLLPNGTLISYWRAGVNGGSFPSYIYFSFDTDGPFQGPNRYGYDYFVYNTVDDGFNSLCNPTYNHSERDKGCYKYAHKNISPIDNTKPYWDILYKPMSYWQQK